MESKENSDLSNRQLTVLPFILSSPSYEEAARRAEISPKQIYEWLKDPTFSAELKRQRKTVFGDALAFLTTGAQKACQTLLNLLDNEDPRIRLVAAEKILTNAFKGKILELEDRLTELENIAEKKSPNGQIGTHR